jgi:hypothetical protein
LVTQKVGHVHCAHLLGVLADHGEERLQIERRRPQSVGPGPAGHELQIPINQRISQPIAALTIDTNPSLHARESSHPNRFPVLLKNTRIHDGSPVY